jgi:hypothetical protein
MDFPCPKIHFLDLQYSPVLLVDFLVTNLQLHPLMKMMSKNGVILMTEEYVFLEDLKGER